VVPHIKPISDIETIPVNGKGFSLKGIQNYEREEFFGELIGAVVVRAIGNGHGETIGLVIGPHEMIGRCL
jgi:hypothetical protein